MITPSLFDFYAKHTTHPAFVSHCENSWELTEDVICPNKSTVVFTYIFLCMHSCTYALCRLTMCSRRADAGEAVNEVETGSTMEAGLRVAFINIIFTVHPLVAWFTLHQWQRLARGVINTNLKHKSFKTYKPFTLTPATNTYTDKQLRIYLLYTHMCPDSPCM